MRRQHCPIYRTLASALASLLRHGSCLESKLLVPNQQLPFDLVSLRIQRMASYKVITWSVLCEGEYAVVWQG